MKSPIISRVAEKLSMAAYALVTAAHFPCNKGLLESNMFLHVLVGLSAYCGHYGTCDAPERGVVFGRSWVQQVTGFSGGRVGPQGVSSDQPLPW